MAEGTDGAVLAPVKAEMEFRLINPTEGGFLKRIEWNRATTAIFKSGLTFFPFIPFLPLPG
ncbi:hypothetical protein IMSAGC007_03042 [Lachnospiraceae bacterium]|nr:hypothetical protein IMSAGC007_03042 [Lachnospiraceae bacterium]